MSTTNTLQHKENQIAKSERQKKRGSDTEKNMQKTKKCKSEHFGNKNVKLRVSALQATT